MRRVVDAMNVIGSRPDGWWRDRRGAIERLVAQLDRWAAEAGEEKVTVVLEKPPSPPLSAEEVEVAWAPRAEPNSADAEILRRLERWLAEGEVIVVTSDRDLAARARSLGAEIEPSSGFRRRLDALGSAAQPGAPEGEEADGDDGSEPVQGEDDEEQAGDSG